MINVQCTPATFEFSQTMYAVQLPEMTPVGSRILQVFPANASEVMKIYSNSHDICMSFLVGELCRIHIPLKCVTFKSHFNVFLAC